MMLLSTRVGRLLLSKPRHFATRAQAPVSQHVTDMRNVDEVVADINRQLKQTSLRAFEAIEYEKELKPRTISDSHAQFRIPLSTNMEKKLEYLSAAGNVRIGKLLEDLDNLAVFVALAHNRQSCSESGIGALGSLPRTVVTAAVQRIDMHKAELLSYKDIILDGRVTYAGTSSMEVSLRVFQDDECGNVQQILKANFIMAARSPATGKAERVHPLVATNTEEAYVINNGRENAKERKRQREQCLSMTYPSIEEFRSLHQNFLLYVKNQREMNIGENQAWQHETRTEVVTICHPENRNMYGNVFGGFLMREALELASNTAKIFVKGRVTLLSVDDIDFVRKVEIGDIVQFESVIVVTKDQYIQVRVQAELFDKSFEKQTSNVFHFTFCTADGKPVKEILPKHYDHGVLWLEGKRQLRKTIAEVMNT